MIKISYTKEIISSLIRNLSKYGKIHFQFALKIQQTIQIVFSLFQCDVNVAIDDGTRKHAMQPIKRVAPGIFLGWFLRKDR